MWSGRLRRLALLAGIASIVVLPLVMTAVNDPEVFGGRASQVSIFTPLREWPGTPADRLAGNIVAVAELL